MSSEKSLTPQIRFKGFTEAWEQRKFLKIYRKNDERNDDRLSANKTLSVATMTFNCGGNGASDESLPNYKRLRIGDIAFEGHANKEFSFGRFVLNDAGDGIMSPRFTCLRPITKQDYSFWKYYIHSEKVMREKLVNSTKSGTMMNELVVEDFLNESILVPSLEEQREIGFVFKSLTNLITLHQRKLDALKKIKSALLEKMFPKDGSDIPEIRFAGFTEAWEQRKLGEVFCESTDRSDTLEILSVSVSNGIYPAIESDRIINPGASISNYKVVYPNDVVFNSMRMWQGAVDVSRYKGIVSPAYVVARPLLEVDARLFSRLLKQPSMLSKYKQISQGNSKDTLTLKYDKFALISIIMPKSIKEQSLISRQFDMLDDLITLHQRKLDALKKIKSALLEKMFV